MKNRYFISFCVQFLLGIMFVFPMYSAEGFETEEAGIAAICFYGDENSSKELKVTSKKRYTESNGLVKYINQLNDFSFIPNSICEADACSVFLLKYSQQIVDISFLRSIRSVVILC